MASPRSSFTPIFNGNTLRKQICAPDEGLKQRKRAANNCQREADRDLICFNQGLCQWTKKITIVIQVIRLPEKPRIP